MIINVLGKPRSLPPDVPKLPIWRAYQTQKTRPGDSIKKNEKNMKIQSKVRYFDFLQHYF